MQVFGRKCASAMKLPEIAAHWCRYLWSLFEIWKLPSYTRGLHTVSVQAFAQAEQEAVAFSLRMPKLLEGGQAREAQSNSY